MKHIPDDVVRDFIKLDEKITHLKADREKMKNRLRKYHARGYAHPKLIFRDAVRFLPPWKKLTQELADKFMKPAARRVYFAKLQKRFPAKAIETSVVIAGKDKSSEEESQ
jgi:hypothetical protein